MALLRALTSIAQTPRMTGGCLLLPLRVGSLGVPTRDDTAEPAVAPVVLGLLGDGETGAAPPALGRGERSGVVMVPQEFC